MEVSRRHSFIPEGKTQAEALGLESPNRIRYPGNSRFTILGLLA